MKKRLSKSFVTAVLVLSMVFGMSFVSNAASVTTDVHHSSGSYELYVWGSGSSNLLGYMELTHTTKDAINTFTAAKNCKATTAYASNMASGYVNESVDSLSANSSVIAKKTVTGSATVSQTYGYCTVSY